LGLSVVHGIVRSHRGEILVYSKPDKGTAFHVYLPIIIGKNEITKIKSQAITGGTENIMIVDDEPVIADMVKNMLESFGYKSEVFKTGFDVIKAYKKQPDKFDLLVTDLTMPNITGLDIANELHKEHADLPIVIITGFGDNITNATRQRYGINEIVGKPIVVRELAETVRKVLDKG